jgi:hypothetical protein
VDPITAVIVGVVVYRFNWLVDALGRMIKRRRHRSRWGAW